jgi:hypothetical protein
MHLAAHNQHNRVLAVFWRVMGFDCHRFSILIFDWHHALVRIFPFCFSAVPPSHPFSPACINPQRAPLPSCFSSLPSPLLQHHCCIALTLPVPVWHHAIVTLLLPCQHHLCIRTATTAAMIPLSPCHCC